MDKIKAIQKSILNEIKNLERRQEQLRYSKKEVKFYYGNRMAEINENISDLRAQIIYYNNYNYNDVIDLHGATRYCVEYYLQYMIEEKLEIHKKVLIITGKGTRIIYNAVSKFLKDKPYRVKVKTDSFLVSYL